MFWGIWFGIGISLAIFLFFQLKKDGDINLGSPQQKTLCVMWFVIVALTGPVLITVSLFYLLVVLTAEYNFVNRLARPPKYRHLKVEVIRNTRRAIDPSKLPGYKVHKLREFIRRNW